MKPGDTVEATVTVTNTGRREATEVVQFYIRGRFVSIARPVKELKHFERVNLKPGESRTVTFPVTAEKLGFYNGDLDFVTEPGDFDIMVGPNSADVDTLHLTFSN